MGKREDVSVSVISVFKGKANKVREKYSSGFPGQAEE